MIEVGVLEGSFRDEELVEYCESFEPVDTLAEKTINITPLARLCYQGRHTEIPITVPTGYWKHQREDVKRLPSCALIGELVAFPVKELKPAGFVLDSAFVFGDICSPQEVDLLYVSPNDRNTYVRILSWAAIGNYSKNLVPSLDEQPCDTRVLMVRSAPVFHAFLEREIGPHEALWQTASRSYICLTKPSPSFGRMDFEMLLEFLVSATSNLKI
jgi:hypothetical protein